MFGYPPIITFIRKCFKLPDDIWKLLHTEISNRTPCIFVVIWSCIGLVTQSSNQSLSWSSQIIFWIWIFDSNLVQTAKLQQYVQGDVLVTTLYLSVFPNIAMTTIVRVHSCELAKRELYLTCELFHLERLPSGATMIIRQWCYNCSELHVHKICISKLWYLTLSIYMIFYQQCLHL